MKPQYYHRRRHGGAAGRRAALHNLRIGVAINKHGTEDGKGSWYTIDGHAKGLHFKLGVPDGDLCLGNNDGKYGGFGANIEFGK